MPAPFGQIHDAGRDAVGVQGQAQDVDRGAEQMVGHTLGEQVERRVGCHQLAARAGHQRRVGQMSVEDRGECLPDRRQLGRCQVGFREHGRETGGQQQIVAIAQGQFERFGEADDHRAARLGSALFEETDVALTRLRANGQVELTDPAQRTPVAQLWAECGGLRGRHGASQPCAGITRYSQQGMNYRVRAQAESFPAGNRGSVFTSAELPP